MPSPLSPLPRKAPASEVDFLRSPWRYNYVRSATESVPSACVFCVAESSDQDAERLVLYRGRLNFVIMNLFPYTSGHLMVAPYRHIGNIIDAVTEQLEEMMLLSRQAVSVLDEAYRPEGYNMGLNLGQAAGAGIRDHMHLHVVPRWVGDTNFMTATCETRVLPEDLEAGYEKLKPLFT